MEIKGLQKILDSEIEKINDKKKLEEARVEYLCKIVQDNWGLMNEVFNPDKKLDEGAVAAEAYDSVKGALSFLNGYHTRKKTDFYIEFPEGKPYPEIEGNPEYLLVVKIGVMLGWSRFIKVSDIAVEKENVRQTLEVTAEGKAAVEEYLK